MRTIAGGKGHRYYNCKLPPYDSTARIEARCKSSKVLSCVFAAQFDNLDLSGTTHSTYSSFNCGLCDTLNGSAVPLPVSLK